MNEMMASVIQMDREVGRGRLDAEIEKVLIAEKKSFIRHYGSMDRVPDAELFEIWNSFAEVTMEDIQRVFGRVPEIY